MPRAVGIDLGTTYSAIAVVNQHGIPEVIRNREGDELTPSVVMFDGSSPTVGTRARRSAVACPLDVVQFVKRQMGQPSWKFRTGEGASFSVEEISAIVLKRLKDDAEAALGDTVEEAVITVPAYFDDAQRKATQDAGRIAGLRVLRIINEPTAAALAYGLSQDASEQTVLVYDLGGGTFDVTILRIGKGRIDVLATGGDKNLGGFDWDNQVMVHLNQEFKRSGGPDLFQDPRHEQDLREKSERAKEALSEAEETTVALEADGVSATIGLTRNRFQELTQALFDRTGRIMGFVLEDSGLAWSQIDKVLLVGGSTRMRGVPALIEAIAGKAPSRELDPDKVVALGAAVQAAMLTGEPTQGQSPVLGGIQRITIKDVNSHSMGVISLGERQLVNSVVLPRGTAYGTRVDEVFRTVRDGQTAIQVRITEGEEEDIRHVKVVGEKEMPIAAYRSGAPIRVSFVYTPDGLIHVDVFDLTASKPLGELRIDRISNKTEAQVHDSESRLSGMNIQ